MNELIDVNLRMTDTEAAVRYPDSYIAIQWDSVDSSMGTVLSVGSNMGDLVTLIMERNEPFCGIVEGNNISRSIDRVVINGRG